VIDIIFGVLGDGSRCFGEDRFPCESRALLGSAVEAIGT